MNMIQNIIAERIDYDNGVNITWSNTKNTHRMNLWLCNGMSYHTMIDELVDAIVVIQSWQKREEAEENETYKKQIAN